MPAVSVDVRDGDPTVEASGEHRGRVSVTFSDGRVIERNLRAPDADAWADRIANIQSTVQQEVEDQDANEAAETDVEILQPYKEASLPKMALAYLRLAQQTENPYRAYLKFSRFNDWRERNGWNLNQVAAQLSSVGLTEDDWTDMRARYLYLANPARVTAMEAYQNVLDGDEWVN
jgi:hypothetical protein